MDLVHNQVHEQSTGKLLPPWGSLSVHNNYITISFNHELFRLRYNSSNVVHLRRPQDTIRIVRTDFIIVKRGEREESSKIIKRRRRGPRLMARNFVLAHLAHLGPKGISCEPEKVVQRSRARFLTLALPSLGLMSVSYGRSTRRHAQTKNTTDPLVRDSPELLFSSLQFI